MFFFIFPECINVLFGTLDNVQSVKQKPYYYLQDMRFSQQWL
jgi:hypothetical protein